MVKRTKTRIWFGCIHSLCVSAMLLGFSCGGKQVSKPVAPVTEKIEPVSVQATHKTDRKALDPLADEDKVNDGLELEGVKGRLHPADIANTLNPKQPKFVRCFEKKWREQPHTGGKIQMAFTVKRDGHIKRVVVENSDLGSWEVEECVLRHASSVVFPRPTGGEADFKLPIEFPSQTAPHWMVYDVIKPQVEAQWGVTEACGEGPKKTKITMYIGKEGTVLDVGFSAKHKIDETWASCTRDALLTWQMEEQRQKVSKLSFNIP